MIRGIVTHPRQWGWTLHWANDYACFNMLRGSTVIFNSPHPVSSDTALEIWGYETFSEHQNSL